MLFLTADNAEEYLRASGRIAPDEAVRIERLAGGVSNEVLYIRRLDDCQGDFVLKQARPQLRVADPWFCSVERIWREVEVLRTCQRVLQERAGVLGASTPQILFEDRENYCFAMQAAPREHVVWKELLLSGRADESIATACGQLLAALHAGTWRDASARAALGDRSMFDALRMDPYYRFTADAQPHAAWHFERLVESLGQHLVCLVHADFSPKNLLVFRGGLMMVDFETGHYGDGAFDLGFFLSHLVLKAFHLAPRHEPYLGLIAAFWRAYQCGLAPTVAPNEYRALVARGIQNLAGCAWARLDGKSKIDYLQDPARRACVRSMCRELFESQAQEWNEALAMVRAQIEQAWAR